VSALAAAAVTVANDFLAPSSSSEKYSEISDSAEFSLAVPPLEKDVHLNFIGVQLRP
jgi:hypothetical protein